MRRRTFIAAAATGLLAGCGGDGDGGEDPPEELTVRIEGIGNSPRRGRVAVGGTVTWVNAHAAVVNAHTVTSTSFEGTTADWEFQAELADEGDEASHTFDEAGVYGYYDEKDGLECRCGAILVGDVELNTAMPCVGSGPGAC